MEKTQQRILCREPQQKTLREEGTNTQWRTSAKPLPCVNRSPLPSAHVAFTVFGVLSEEGGKKLMFWCLAHHQGSAEFSGSPPPVYCQILKEVPEGGPHPRQA